MFSKFSKILVLNNYYSCSVYDQSSHTNTRVNIYIKPIPVPICEENSYINPIPLVVLKFTFNWYQKWVYKYSIPIYWLLYWYVFYFTCTNIYIELISNQYRYLCRYQNFDPTDTDTDMISCKPISLQKWFHILLYRYLLSVWASVILV